MQTSKVFSGCAILSGLGLFAALTACGGDDTPEPQKPTPAEVRDYYGLNNGSCWRYRFSAGQTSAFATVTAEGPNNTAFTDYTTFRLSYQRDSGGQPTEWYFDTDGDPGAVLLLREVSGDGAERKTTNFVDTRPAGDRDGTVGPAVTYLRLDFDRMGALVPTAGKFETNTTPLVSKGGNTVVGTAENHVWTDLGEVEVLLPTGTSTGTEYDYQRPEGSSRWTLARGFGFAKFTDFDNVVHQVCDARVCDSSGSCTGATSCQELFCQ